MFIDGVFPASICDDSLHFQYKLADFVLLALFLGIHVLPTKFTRACPTIDICNNMPTCHKLSVLTLANPYVTQSLRGRESGWRDKKRSTVSAGEALRDDLGGKGDVCGAC